MSILLRPVIETDVREQVNLACLSMAWSIAVVGGISAVVGVGVVCFVLVGVNGVDHLLRY
jgi:hypothetical protein